MLTQDRLKELLSYDKETGVFTWKVDRPHRFAGIVAGHVNSIGYEKISIDNIRYYSHRLVFFYINGKFPINDVDHINGSRDDNRMVNLRETTKSGNSKNRGITNLNKSGRVGVSWHSRDSKWRAYIKTNGKAIHLGYFDDILDASKAREAAEKKYGFHVNHGKRAAAI